METSDSIKQIAPALLAAQQAIAFAAKDSKNPAFKSSYANLESVIDAIKAPLNGAGILFSQSFSPSVPGFLSLTTCLIHTSGEWIKDTLNMPLQKQDAQGYGSAATYARRYALAAITGLYQADDDGTEACRPAPKAKSVDLMALIADMDAADSEAALKAAFAAAWKASNGNATIKTHYEKLKAQGVTA